MKNVFDLYAKIQGYFFTKNLPNLAPKIQTYFKGKKPENELI